jgi:hypothetical protein
VQQIVNIILDDILANTYAFLQLKPDLPGWRKQDELFDMGVIDHEIHQHAINKLKERWFSLYITQENRWKRKINMYID